MSNMVKVGVIGVGYLGSIHARVYSELPEADLVGVADVDAETAGKIAQKYNAVPYSDYGELIERVDAVSIVTPTVTHYEIALDCLKRGIHVLVEKPICSTIRQAEELGKLAEGKNLVLQVGHIERFNSGIIAVSEVIDNPRYIETERLGVFSGRGTDMDVISELMIHDLDLITSWLSYPVSEIRAVGVPVLTGKVDIANVRLEYENGCVAVLSASRVSAKKFRKVRIFQDNAYISLDFMGQNYEFYSREPFTGSAPHPLLPGIHYRKVEPEKEEPLKLELSSFIEAVKNNAKPAVDAWDAIRALRLSQSIMEALKQHARKYN